MAESEGLDSVENPSTVGAEPANDERSPAGAAGAGTVMVSCLALALVGTPLYFLWRQKQASVPPPQLTDGGPGPSSGEPKRRPEVPQEEFLVDFQERERVVVQNGGSERPEIIDVEIVEIELDPESGGTE